MLIGRPVASFCHNDCYYGNVLAIRAGDRCDVSALVDCENIVAGDPILDLAKTHCYALDRRSERTLQALADGHGDLPPSWRDGIDLYSLPLDRALDWFAHLGKQIHAQC
jgi:hygromycin-B 7''-O-kinase